MEKKKRHKRIHPLLLGAKIVSSIFHPSYYPLVCLGLLFFCTFLEYVSLKGIFFILSLTAILTIFLPSLLIYIYRSLYGIAPERFHHRHERFIPYIIHLVCYILLLRALSSFNIHGLVIEVIVISILIQICCTLINCFWKISIHSAGAGGIVGFLVSHSYLFEVSPILPIVVSILLCGLVASSRLVLRRHTLAQVNVGALVGIACGMLGSFVIFLGGVLWFMCSPHH